MSGESGGREGRDGAEEAGSRMGSAPGAAFPDQERDDQEQGASHDVSHGNAGVHWILAPPSTFDLCAPLAMPASVSRLSDTSRHASSAPRQADEQRRPRLLVVDDDRLVLAMLEEALADAGYQVTTAANAAEALALVARSNFDLALLDICMPGMDGIELARHLHETHPVPLLFLSARSDAEIVRSAVDSGGLGYLLKPVDASQLVPAIEAALMRAREIQSLKDIESRLSAALQVEQKTRMAVGVIMERRQLDRQAAFEAIRQLARSQRRKVVDVAEEILGALECLNQVGADPHPDRH